MLLRVVWQKGCTAVLDGFVSGHLHMEVPWLVAGVLSWTYFFFLISYASECRAKPFPSFPISLSYYLLFVPKLWPSPESSILQNRVSHSCSISPTYFSLLGRSLRHRTPRVMEGRKEVMVAFRSLGSDLKHIPPFWYQWRCEKHF